MERQELEKLSKEYELASEISFELHRAEQMLNDVNNDNVSIRVDSQRFSNYEFSSYIGDELFDELKVVFRQKVRDYYDKCVNKFLNHKIDINTTIEEQ